MPKIVNHEKQKEKIAEAVWRVLKSKGFTQVTLRIIAKEAGIPESTMRYYFPTQEKLLLFSMNLINIRAAERIKKLQTTDSPFDDVVMLLKELLPLRDQTCLEVHAWYFFLLKSLTDQALRPLAEEMQDGMYWFMWMVLERLEENKLLKPDIDKKREARSLQIFIDGLAFHCLFTKTLSEQMIDDMLRRRLQEICVTP